MRYFIFSIFFLLSAAIFGQTTVKLDITVIDMNSKKKEAGVTATVYDGSKQVASSVTTSNGKVNLTVPAGPNYKVEFKKAGKVTRFFNADTKGIDMELIQGSEMPFVYCEVSLFDEVQGVDFSYVKNTPFTVFKFDGQSANLSYDQKMAGQMSQKIEQLLAQASQANQNNEVQYQAKMKKGEELAAQNKYEEALTNFEQALMFKQADKTALKRISDMEKLLTSSQINTLNGEALNAEFENLKKEAEALKAAKKYEEAIDKFEEALTKKRNDQYCLDEIDRLEKIVKEEKLAKENEAKYKQAMTLGDQMLGQKSYETALKKYEEALLAKPNDPAATAKKQQVEKILDGQKAEKEKKAQYEQLVAEADALYNEEKWAAAKAKYQEAFKIETASTYVSGRIKEIDEKLAAQEKEKQKQEQIQKLLADANGLFTASKWNEAKVKYQEVQKLDAANATAKEQIAIIDQKLNEEKDNAAKQQQFTALVAEGDKLVTAKSFENAIAKYKEALQIKEDAAVQQKITAANTEMEKLKNAAMTKQMYDAAIKEGNDLLAKNELENARAKFVEASTLDETQKLPKDKIAEIDAKIAEQKGKQQQQEQFKELLAMADELFAKGDLNGAKSKYEQAKLIDKTSPIPDQKIKEINDLLAKQQADEQKKNEIAALLTKGDEQFAAKKYEEAIASYKKVLEKDAGNQKAIQQIELIEKALSDKKQAEADELAKKQANEALAKKNASYAAAIAKGDELKTAGKYTEAIGAYESAKAFTEDPAPVNAKIQEVNELLANAEKAKQAKDLQEKYNTAFQKGEGLKTAGKYQEAIAAYNEAKAIDPSKTDPDVRISEINQLLADQTQKEALAKQKAEQIAVLVADGDALFAGEKYTEAIAKYSEVKTIDPANTVVDAKIAKANEMLKQLLAKQSQKEIEEKYNTAFKKGLEELAAQNYDAAISAFTQAKAIDPSKPEPQVKIDEINKLKAQLAEQKSAEALAQKYNAFIEEGDAALASKNYDAALSAFRKASDLMKAEEYPKKKIEEINNLLEIEKLSKEKEENEAKYLALMQKANTSFSGENYQEALTDYQVAKQLKNTEEVQAKITETKDKIAALEKQKGEAEIQKQYNQLMEVARTAEAANDLQTAIENYKKAGRVKTEEQEPKDKIAALSLKLEEQQKLAAIENSYKQAMTAGNTAFEKEDYDAAIKHYTEASSIKEKEQEPKDKIALSKEKLKNISTKDEDVQFEKMLVFAQQKIEEKDYKKALELIERAEDNRPNEPRLLQLKKKVQELMVKDEEYNEFIAKADAAAGANDLKTALELYGKAQAVKPQEAYPPRRIAEIKAQQEAELAKASSKEKYEQLLTQAKAMIAKDELENALTAVGEAIVLDAKDSRARDLMKEIEQLLLAKNAKKNNEALEEQYKTLLTNADQLFENGKWSDAKMAYEKAQVIKPKNDYIKQQITRCTEEISKSSLNKSKYLAIVATADNDFGMLNYEKAKAGYELALTYDNSQRYPKDQIAEIDRLMAQKSKKSDGQLDPLGEEIDISLLEGMALLAKAEEYRKTSKGQLVKEEKNKVVLRHDSVAVVRDEFVAQNLDSLKLTKGILLEDLTEYYDNQFEKDKEIRTIDKNQTDLMDEKSGFTYSDNVENKRKMVLIEGIKVDREKQYVDHNFDLVDSVKYIRQNLEGLYTEFTGSDYDSIMRTNQFLKGTKDIQEQNKIDDFEDHLVVVDLTKNQKEIAVQEGYRQAGIHSDKIDNVVDILEVTEDKGRERDTYFEKNHEGLIDGITAAEMKAIEEDNKNFNNVYTKQMKAKVMVTNEQTLAYNENQQYLENKSLDIDKSRVRLNETNFKYSSDEKNDDEQREGARLFIKGTEQQTENQLYTETKKNEVKADNVKDIAKNEKTLDESKNKEKKESIYDTRSDLKTLEYSKVIFPPKVANEIGQNYPEGVSQEVFKQNGPDGLPNAIITRRIVVINGYGNVYTRTQKYGSITYSKNGEICTEQIWRNETTDPKLEKHY